MLGAADAAALGEHATIAADLRFEMTTQSGLAFLAQTLRPLLDDGAIELRHARGGRAGPRRKREDVQLRQTTFVDQIERAGEHVFGLGREIRQ